MIYHLNRYVLFLSASFCYDLPQRPSAEKEVAHRMPVVLLRLLGVIQDSSAPLRFLNPTILQINIVMFAQIQIEITVCIPWYWCVHAESISIFQY